MRLLIVSYLAGILTAAAPCILPLLPIIIGGTVIGENKKKQWWRPFVIISSLALSILVFTFLLKASTALLGVPQYIWNTISGLIVLLLGIGIVFPNTWEKIALKTGLYKSSNGYMNKILSRNNSLTKDILIGSSLGPVFSSCSPTYALIVAIVLPESLLRGTTYLISYVLGLSSILLLIAFAGQSVSSRLNWMSNPESKFRKIIGILFILVGLAVITGLDRDLQAFVIENGWYNPIMRIEENLQ